MVEISQSNTSFNRFEIIKSGIATVDKAVNTDMAGTQLAHGLPYLPANLSFYTDADEFVYSQLPHTEFTSGGLLALQINLAVTDTYLTFNVFAPDVLNSSIYDNAYTFYIKYYLLQERAS